MSTPHLNEIIDNLSLTYHLENSSLGIILCNSELNIIYASQKACEIFGWATDAYLQRPISLESMVYEEDTKKVIQVLEEISSGRVLHNQGVNRNYTTSGEVIYCQWYNSALVDDAHKVINFLSLVQDVTEQMQNTLALQASEHQLSQMFNGAIDPMWLIKVEGNERFTFERINSAFSKVTGWKKDQVVGQPIEAVMPESSHKLVRAKYNEAIGLCKIIDYVEEAAHPAGIKYGEIRVIPLVDENGDVNRLLGIANDITDKVQLQKRLEAERDLYNRKITYAAIKGQELERAKVSSELHDNVNQVLTTVKLYLELCRDDRVDSNEILSKCSILLNRTIDDIRNLSKQLSVPSLEKINFRETLNDLAASIGVASGMNIDLTIDLDNCSEMDSELYLTIYRIAQEQLTNIIKYAKAKIVHIILSFQNGIMQLSIEDNGVGFDTSQRTNGIGLTNIGSRAAILGGSVEIKSELNKGTTISAFFPVKIIDGKCIPEEVIESLYNGFKYSDQLF
ncbi:MAG TPA: PAS domain S-box protein [Flavisolibacter sp.]|nr:PAS domain S-box protein [Flavisolibacter sp.]